MKGKTKGERKNKSIKKNQIPAFILTGGEIKEYSDFVNNDNQNYQEAMEHAANEVKQKLQICNENAAKLQQLKKQETTNMTKLAELVQTLQTSQTENKSKIDECNNIKNELVTAKNELTRLKDVEHDNNNQIAAIEEKTEIIDTLTEQLKDAKIQHETQARETVAQNLVSNSIGDAVTNIANKKYEEIDNKIKTLEEEKTRFIEDIQRLTQQNEELLKEKDRVNEGIKKTEGDLTKIQSELDASNAKNTELAGVISAHYDNLKKIIEDQTTIVKEGVDGEGISGNIDVSSIEDLENSGNKLQELSGKIERLMATNQEQLIVNENIRLENEQLKKANAKLTEDNAILEQEKNEIEQGTHERLSDITTQIAAGKEKLASIQEEKVNAEGIIKQSKEATLTVQQAQEELKAIQTQAEQANQTINVAEAAKTEAETAKAEAETAKQNVVQADNKCQEDLAAAESAKKKCEEELLAVQVEKNKALSENQTQIDRINTELKRVLEEKEQTKETNILLDMENLKNKGLLNGCEEEKQELQTEKEQLQETIKTLTPLKASNEVLSASKDRLEKQLNNSISKEECNKLVEEATNLASAKRVAGEAAATQDMEPKYDENEILKSIDIKKVEENDLEKYFNEDDITILSSSIESITKPKDGPDKNNNIIDDMDYKIERNYDNVEKHFNNNLSNGKRTDYHLNTHKIDTRMLFLFVHDKRKSMNDNIDDNNRQIYICRIENIDNNNITADCWNISTSMNEFLKKYHEEQFKIDKLKKEDFQKYSVTINPDDSKQIKFSTIPHKDKHNKQLPKIYKELLTPIIHKGVVIDKGKNQNQNIYLGNHAYNGNLSGYKDGKLIGIKNQNIIPVYPYGEHSFQLLRRSTDNSSFQNSKNYIIYLTDYESIINKHKYFPVIKRDDNKFIMFFRKDAELRYLHTLIEYAKTHTFLKQGDITALNTYAETGFQKQQQKQTPQQEKTLEQQDPIKNTNDRLKKNAIDSIKKNRKGGKKNLTKEYMKGGYRYSALGMKGLTIDLSGLKGKKTRRVKKKGKTVKNKKGSRKVKKGSRKDKTKKNKKRGRTYRNKNNFF